MTASPGKSGESGGTVVERGPAGPDRERISTSFVERQNLSMRMGMRRFTRLTNGFSKKRLGDPALLVPDSARYRKQEDPRCAVNSAAEEPEVPSPVGIRAFAHATDSCSATSASLNSSSSKS